MGAISEIDPINRECSSRNRHFQQKSAAKLLQFPETNGLQFAVGHVPGVDQLQQSSKHTGVLSGRCVQTVLIITEN